MPIRSPWPLLLLLVLFTAGGAACPRVVEQYTFTPPDLPESTTLEQIAERVNGNADRVDTLSAEDMSLRVGHLPAMRGTFAYESPLRMRLIGETGLTGPEVDIGSNDQLFWLWVRRNQPQALYYATHDAFARSPLRQSLPIEPAWLLEAFGLVRIDLERQHVGPFAREDGRLEIHTPLPAAGGSMTRVIYVRKNGRVDEVQLYDASRRLMCSAQMSDFRYDPLAEVDLPRQIEIECPPARFNLTINVPEWIVNLPRDAPASRWQMPEYPGWQPVDITRADTDRRSSIPAGFAPNRVSPP